MLEHGIAYVFLGQELGGRTQDPGCYQHGKVQYDRLAQTESFRDGLRRVQEGVKKYRLAIMCAEKEPLECHRTILVARHLTVLGLDVLHIHADGRLESHADALSRLAQILNLPERDMFRSSEELLDDAYHRQEERIEDTIPREMLDGGCLLCSEEKPHHCHRRLVAEYLKAKWGDVEIEHIQ